MPFLENVAFLALAAALAITGYFYWLLMTPVTVGNVQLRLGNYCYLGTKALHLSENSRLAPGGLQRGSCGCLAEKLVNGGGPAAAAALTEGARRLGVLGMRRKLSSGQNGGGLLSKTGAADLLAAEFAERYVSAANACVAAAGS
jgi:hypothetical protein